MAVSNDPVPARRITRGAILAGVAVQVLPCLYSLCVIASPSYYRGPFDSEMRWIILVVGLIGAALGAAALIKGTRRKAVAITAIVLSLSAVLWNIAFCSGSPLDATSRFCPMMWGIKIP
jgi:hypothetical protein